MYRDLCEKILHSDPSIREVFLVSSQARVLASSGVKDATEISEERFAELMEDLLFIVNSRAHYEDLFGKFQSLRVGHKKTETLVLPFENDKLLCICSRTLDLEYDKEYSASSMQSILQQLGYAKY